MALAITLTTKGAAHKSVLVTVEFPWNFSLEFGILGFGMRNTVQGFRNLSHTWKSGIHVPLTNNPESSTWNPESMIVLGSPVTCVEMLCRDILAYNEIMVEPDLHVFSVRLSKLNETISYWKWAQYIIKSIRISYPFIDVKRYFRHWWKGTSMIWGSSQS